MFVMRILYDVGGLVLHVSMPDPQFLLDALNLNILSSSSIVMCASMNMCSRVLNMVCQASKVMRKKDIEEDNVKR